MRTIKSAIVAFLAVVTSCAPSPRVSLPPSPPIVTVQMREYEFDYQRPISSGRVVFRIFNRGQRIHRLTLLPLTEDIPPIKDQLSGPNRISIAPYAGISNRKTGQFGTFSVDLPAGQRYALLCLIRDADGKSHAVKGMASEFRTLGFQSKIPVAGTGGSVLPNTLEPAVSSP